jgi:U3 small nucleolar RNA-associated protein 6
MAGSSEYRREQLIDQYEHITKLELLTDEELSHLKRKRSAFEMSIQKSNEIKPYIDYIKFETALMKKFKLMDFKNERDGKALDRAIATQVKDIFRIALKKFQDKRKIWGHYITFAKQKFPNTLTRIYEEMLCYHHKVEDFIEAADYEMFKKNYTTAMNFLLQGMGNHKDSCEQLVVAYIKCSMKQGNIQGDSAKEAVLLQASKFYVKFLKDSTDVAMHCDLLQKIQQFKYSVSFQNDVLTNVMRVFADRAEVWDVLAKRHLDGLFYEPPKENEEDEKATETQNEEKKIPFDVCLRNAITIYEKSLDSVGELQKQKMFSFYIAKLLELDSEPDSSASCLKVIRQALGKSLMRGYTEEKLSAEHFILFLELRMINIEKNRSDIEEMLEVSSRLYPSSMEIYELSIKYFVETKNYDDITKTFNFAIDNNEKSAVELYRFLCAVYLKSEDKEKARAAMFQAVNSENRKVSEAFQPYYIEYHSSTDGIEKAREVFNQLLTTRTLNSLSLEFFKTMIKIEQKEDKPDEKMISNCYERATEHFGKESPEVN